MNKKTQLITTDLIVAVTIFIFIIVITIFPLWGIYEVRLNDRIDQTKMELKSFQVADILIKTPGIPNGWETLNNEEQIIIPGLAMRNKEVLKEKIQKFTQLSEETIKTKLKINEYNFYFSLKILDNTEVGSVGSIPQNPKNIFSIKDYVSYNDNGVKQDAIMEIKIWE